MAKIKELNKILKNANSLVNKLQKILENKRLLDINPQEHINRLIHNTKLNGFWDIYTNFVANGGLKINKTLIKYPGMIQKLLLSFYDFLNELGMLKMES